MLQAKGRTKTALRWLNYVVVAGLFAAAAAFFLFGISWRGLLFNAFWISVAAFALLLLAINLLVKGLWEADDPA